MKIVKVVEVVEVVKDVKVVESVKSVEVVKGVQNVQVVGIRQIVEQSNREIGRNGEIEFFLLNFRVDGNGLKPEFVLRKTSISAKGMAHRDRHPFSHSLLLTGCCCLLPTFPHSIKRSSEFSQ